VRRPVFAEGLKEKISFSAELFVFRDLPRLTSLQVLVVDEQ
jgi:hypothetical protein